MKKVGFLLGVIGGVLGFLMAFEFFFIGWGNSKSEHYTRRRRPSNLVGVSAFFLYLFSCKCGPQFAEKKVRRYLPSNQKNVI